MKEPQNLSLYPWERFGGRELNSINSTCFAHFPLSDQPHGSMTEIPFADPNPMAKIFAKSA